MYPGGFQDRSELWKQACFFNIEVADNKFHENPGLHERWTAQRKMDLLILHLQRENDLVFS